MSISSAQCGGHRSAAGALSALLMAVPILRESRGFESEGGSERIRTLYATRELLPPHCQMYFSAQSVPDQEITTCLHSETSLPLLSDTAAVVLLLRLWQEAFGAGCLVTREKEYSGDQLWSAF